MANWLTKISKTWLQVTSPPQFIESKVIKDNTQSPPLAPRYTACTHMYTYTDANMHECHAEINIG